MKSSIFNVKCMTVSVALPMLVAMILFTGSAGPVTASVQDAVATYKTKCASCHGLDGSGATATGKKLKVRDLRAEEVQKQTDAQLQALIAKGKGKMPGYEKTLGADKVKELTAYMRQLAKKG